MKKNSKRSAGTFNHASFISIISNHNSALCGEKIFQAKHADDKTALTVLRDASDEHLARVMRHSCQMLGHGLMQIKERDSGTQIKTTTET